MSLGTAQLAPLSILENWLEILISTYCQHPSKALAKVIDYYISRILAQDELSATPLLKCQYISMKKYWRWQSK
ncbi:hypothetical protein tinsulaeT_29930 [Thalassotalea insulae]|uniref:Uncharacterized protein n=2 Tax=Thalassotalea insulae TaxID=2056778 RepID=A0ABQ6GUP2_9GAMM|nr:hypothetical protein tinsulaeT_29930 [Thalassotalea insulae]